MVLPVRPRGSPGYVEARVQDAARNPRGAEPAVWGRTGRWTRPLPALHPGAAVQGS